MFEPNRKPRCLFLSRLLPPYPLNIEVTCVYDNSILDPHLSWLARILKYDIFFDAKISIVGHSWSSHALAFPDSLLICRKVEIAFKSKLRSLATAA